MSRALRPELAGRARRAQPQEAGKERRRCPLCPCFPVFPRVSGRPRRAALRGPFRLPVKPSQPSANLGGTAAAGETGAPQQPGVQLTVLPQPFASPRPFPAHFLRGGRGTALHPCPRRLGTRGRSRLGGAGQLGHGATHTVTSLHRAAFPTALRALCCLGPPQHSPGCQAVSPECGGGGGVAPAARLPWGSCAPPAHPRQLQQRTGAALWGLSVPSVDSMLL